MARVLNLYAGLGGNRKLWKEVDVTAIETDKKIAEIYHDQNPNDKIIIADAHRYLIDHYNEFDFVWSSPPCQRNSKMMKATRHNVANYPDLRLYEEIIFLTHFFKGKWVIENVKPYYDPLIPPTSVMGRHYFWSNFNISAFNISTIKGFMEKGTVKGANELKKWLGIQYEGNIYYKDNHCPCQVLRNCVHPDLGIHILNEANLESIPKGKTQNYPIQNNLFQ